MAQLSVVILPIRAVIGFELVHSAIADYLDQEAAKIDQMVAKVEAAIERLQEYRTALITAAVTGKIDVRGLATAAGQPRPQTIAEPDRQNIPNTV